MPRGETLKGNLFDWTRDNIAFLRAQWGQPGISARTIAEALGCTRSALIGKAHRLGLPNLGNPVGNVSGHVFTPNPTPRQPYERRDETGAKKVTGVPRGGGKKSISSRLACAQTCAKKRADRERMPEIFKGCAASSTLQREEARTKQLPANPTREPVPQLRLRLADSEQAHVSPSVPWDGQPVRQEVIGARQCRWIVGNERGGADALMCGATFDAAACRPFCPEHSKRALGKPAASTGNLAAIDNWSPAARAIGAGTPSERAATIE